MADFKLIGIVGGTGSLGSAIARRLARSGYRVVLGSREAAKADSVASGIGLGTSGVTNAQAAAAADIVIVAVPFKSQLAVLTEIAPFVRNKIVVDATVPLLPPKVAEVQLPAEGSAAVRARQILGADVRVVSAFHNVAAAKLDSEADIDCDVLVFGDDKSSRDEIVLLTERMGLRGLHGGVLANSAAAEALTSVLIFLNKNYGIAGAGIRITGAFTRLPS
jgi:NADPH-dependent F420 reductase